MHIKPCIVSNCQDWVDLSDSRTTFRDVTDGTHTMWLDNFSKVYAQRSASCDIGAWRDCLWTGVALNAYEGDVKVKMTVQFNDDGSEMIPMMPDDPFVNQSMLMAVYDRANRVGLDYLDVSLVKKYDVRRLPLKLPYHDDPVINQKLQRSMDGMRSFFPAELLRTNIGSNMGLFRFMRKVYTDMGLHQPQHQPTTVKCLVVDSNIFSRTFKVRFAFLFQMSM